VRFVVERHVRSKLGEPAAPHRALIEAGKRQPSVGGERQDSDGRASCSRPGPSCDGADTIARRMAGAMHDPDVRDVSRKPTDRCRHDCCQRGIGYPAG